MDYKTISTVEKITDKYESKILDYIERQWTCRVYDWSDDLEKSFLFLYDILHIEFVWGDTEIWVTQTDIDGDTWLWHQIIEIPTKILADNIVWIYWSLKHYKC